MNQIFYIQKLLDNISIDEIKKFCIEFEDLFFEQCAGTLYVVPLFYDVKSRMTNIHYERMMRAPHKEFLYHDFRYDIASFHFSLNINQKRFEKLWIYKNKLQ